VAVLQFESVSKEYAAGPAISLRRSRVLALRDVSFTLEEGETLGLVGESGSGKSTIARISVGLLAASSGRVSLNGNSIADLSPKRLREARSRVGYVFQDPYASLNPRHRIGAMLALPFRIHTRRSPGEIRGQVLDLLEKVGLSPAERYAGRYPHQLSGGQRQRVAVARAMALKPDLLIADEPVASLDVSVAGQILNLLSEVQREIRSSALFISHDLGIVRAMSDRTIVLNRGRIVESGRTEDVLARPAHPYTQLLLASTPEFLQLDAVDPAEPARQGSADGCPFYSRCPYAMARCVEMPPALRAGPEHSARCWLLEQPDPPGRWAAAMRSGPRTEVND
jgi:peptide/nickel transport system ATP-binding protein